MVAEDVSGVFFCQGKVSAFLGYKVKVEYAVEQVCIIV